MCKASLMVECHMDIARRKFHKTRARIVIAYINRIYQQSRSSIQWTFNSLVSYLTYHTYAFTTRLLSFLRFLLYRFCCLSLYFCLFFLQHLSSFSLCSYCSCSTSFTDVSTVSMQQQQQQQQQQLSKNTRALTFRHARRLSALPILGTAKTL